MINGWRRWKMVTKQELQRNLKLAEARNDRLHAENMRYKQNVLDLIQLTRNLEEKVEKLQEKLRGEK